MNIANFALGRSEKYAVGVVNVDEEPASSALEESVQEIRRIAAIRQAWVVRLRELPQERRAR